MSSSATSAALVLPPLRAARECPLNTGVAVLDQLLAALGQQNDAAGLDAALDLRLALDRNATPSEILTSFFHLRAVIEDRHYLACYRLRRWLDAQYHAQVRVDRTQPAMTVDVPLATVSSFAALIDACARTAGITGPALAWTRVHFVPASGRLV